MRKLTISLVIGALYATQLFSPVSADTIDYSKSSVTASESIDTHTTADSIKIYLNTFRPNLDVWFTFNLSNSQALMSKNPSVVESMNFGALNAHLQLPSNLSIADKSKPVATFEDPAGITRISIYSMPSDFPELTAVGDTEAINKLNFLTTPTVAAGSYAIATQGTKISFFVKSAKFLVGFRQLNDSVGINLPSGIAKYAYLEKVELNRPNYSPGVWRLLDSEFEMVGRVASMILYGQTIYSEGHGITSSPMGNPVIMAYVPRSVDRTWLKFNDKPRVLDCVVAEVVNGKARNSFSVWDWANTHRDISTAIMNAGIQDVDITMKGNPVDFCHMNSLQYFKATQEYVVSLRSLDLILVLDKSMKNVLQVLYSPGSKQHFARFNSSTKITALGNYTNDKFSKFMSWDFVDGKWKLTETVLPIHVQFCGNTQVVDPTHIWVGGGCPAYANGVLGSLFDISGTSPVEVASLTSTGIGYSYRTDLYKP